VNHQIAISKNNTKIASETATRQLKNAHLTHLLVGKNQREHHKGPWVLSPHQTRPLQPGLDLWVGSAFVVFRPLTVFCLR